MATTPPLAIRRLVLAPLIVALEIGLVLVSPLVLVAAVVVSPAFGGWRPVRMVVIVISFALHHLAACAACARLWVASDFGRRVDAEQARRAHYDVLRSFVDGVYRTVVRAARVEVRLSESAAVEAILSSSRRPAVVLSRHAGEGDTLLVIHHLLCRHQRRPRIVMHERLRLDPVIDVLGTRLPNLFIDPRGGDTEVAIGALARGMDERTALLIFPEGGNSNARRRRRAIERLADAGHCEEAGWARGMRHMSAPRPGGALAAIDAAPDPIVIFMAHVGVPTSLREAWRLLPHPQTIEVRLWAVPAQEVPANHEQRIDWLFAWWRTLDDWVSERHAAAASTADVS